MSSNVLRPEFVNSSEGSSRPRTRTHSSLRPSPSYTGQLSGPSTRSPPLSKRDPPLVQKVRKLLTANQDHARFLEDLVDRLLVRSER